MSCSTRKRAQRGFTLVEVVVSLAILALALGVLYQSFGWSLRRTVTLERTEAAWLTAQSLLADVRRQGLLQVGVRRGEQPGGLQWKTQVDLHDATVDENSPLRPFAVTIDVRWGQRDSQRVRLESIELGRVAT